MLTQSMTKQDSEVLHYVPQAGFTKKLLNASSLAELSSGLRLASATESAASSVVEESSSTESSLSESSALPSLTSDSTASSVEESSTTTASIQNSSASATFIDKYPTSATSIDKSSASATSVEKLSSAPSASGAPPTTDLQDSERPRHRPRRYSEIKRESFSELMAMSREELKASIRAMHPNFSTWHAPF